MIYEITNTNISMTDHNGNDLGFHPVYGIEAASEAEAIEQWQRLHGDDTSGLQVKEVG